MDVKFAVTVPLSGRDERTPPLQHVEGAGVGGGVQVGPGPAVACVLLNRAFWLSELHFPKMSQ